MLLKSNDLATRNGRAGQMYQHSELSREVSRRYIQEWPETVEWLITVCDLAHSNKAFAHRPGGQMARRQSRPTQLEA